MIFLLRFWQSRFRKMPRWLASIEYCPLLVRVSTIRESGWLTEAEIEGILGEVKQKETDRVIFKNEQLYRFFPSTYTSEQMRREILEILKSWRNSNWI